jgi:hypothetical protein
VVALVLLAGAIALSLGAGLTAGGLVGAPAASSGLGLLGLLLVFVGTVAELAAFRSGDLVRAGGGPALRRLSPRARGTFAILGLAAAAVGSAAALAPATGLYLCLVLLLLGAGSGLAATLLHGRAGSAGEPLPWRVSPRGWVSLGLLASAGVVLGAAQFGPTAGWREAAPSLSVGDRGGAETPKSSAASPTPWTERSPYRGDPGVAGGDTRRLPKSPSVVDLSEWKHGP